MLFGGAYLSAVVRHNYAGIYVLQQAGVCELYQNKVLLARTDNTAIVDKLFFKLALEIASTRVGAGARAQLTADGKRAFGCGGTPSSSEEGEGDDNPSTADAVHLPLGKEEPTALRSNASTSGQKPERAQNTTTCGKGGDEEKPKRKVFKKPTVEEIADYCREKGYTLTDPQAFYDYHESGGWMVGRKKMQDWKAAVRTWERKEKTYATEKAEREKRYERRSRNSVERNNPPVSGLHLEEFEQALWKSRPPVLEPRERSENDGNLG